MINPLKWKYTAQAGLLVSAIAGTGFGTVIAYQSQNEWLGTFKPPPVQGLLVVLTKMRVLAFGGASSGGLNGPRTLNRTGTPVLDCRSLIWVPPGDRGGGRQRQRRLPAIYEPGKNASLKHKLLTTGRDGHSGR